VSEKIKDGVYKRFHESGFLKEEITYKDGQRNGPFKTYHYTGEIWEEGSYCDNNIFESLDGPYKMYYENGQLQLETVYKNSKEIGPTKYYDYKGKRYYKRKNGVFKTYHSNGEIDTSESYKNGLLHGLRKRFWDNGQLMFKEKYINGKIQDGEYVEYDEDGLKCYESSIKNGVHSTFYKTFHKNGKINDSRKPGGLKTYDINGELIFHCQYDEYGEMDILYDKQYEDDMSS